MKFFSSIVVSLTSVLLAPELVRGEDHRLGVGIKTSNGYGSSRSDNSCPGKKEVKLIQFCNFGDLDGGRNGVHRFWLHDGYVNERTAYPENACHDIDFGPKIVNPGEQLLVGTTEFDDDPGDENDEYLVFLNDNQWYDDTCGTYHIAVSMDFQSNFISACWAWNSGVDDPNLGIDRCPGSYEASLDDEALSFFLEISPAHEPPIPLGSKVDFPEGWTDSANDGCDWYAEGYGRCDSNGHLHQWNGLVANDVCVVCGGGKTVRDSNKVDFPEGWTDSANDGCDWYAEGHGRCDSDGHLHQSNGLVANDVCVVCGGGRTVTPSWKINYPPGWYDYDFYGCDYYADGQNCELEGHLYPRNGLVANDVCAVCGGGKWAY